MSWDKKHREERLISNKMEFTKHGFYEDNIFLPDNCTKYYLTPYCTEVSDDFYPIAKRIMNKVLQPYHTITHIASFNLQKCSCKKQCPFNKIDHFTTCYYKFLEAHGMTENVFLDGVDKIVILDKGLSEPVTRLSIESTGGYSILKENISYTVYGYKTPQLIKSLSEAKVCMERITYDVFMEFAKYPDYLTIAHNINTLDINSIVKIIHDTCEDYKKILRVDLGEI